MLTNPHCVIDNPRKGGKTCIINGKYDYYHYKCDGFDDRGWGCGYRTLQTICSWIIENYGNNSWTVPTIPVIQKVLVDLDDKPASFLGSKDWIGSYEVCLVIDRLYDIPCKIIHVPKDKRLDSISDSLESHFNTFGSPVMMGGDLDCSSKGILGIHRSDSETYLLILDPHFVGEPTAEILRNKGYLKWQKLSEFIDSSFYNLCLPQIKHKILDK